MAERRAIVGLGNPGPKYEGTRHNIGFVVIDLVAAELAAPISAERDGALWSRRVEPAGEVYLTKPQTYMNRSGEPLRALLEAWQLPIEAVLVVHDDVDLELGRLKLKRGGGTGGHRGLQSIEEETGSRNFDRLRIGVGRPTAAQDTADFVLERFSSTDADIVREAAGRACQGVLDWLRLDFQAAMKNINTRPEKAVEPGVSGC